MNDRNEGDPIPPPIANKPRNSRLPWKTHILAAMAGTIAAFLFISGLTIGLLWNKPAPQAATKPAYQPTAEEAYAEAIVVIRQLLVTLPSSVQFAPFREVTMKVGKHEIPTEWEIRGWLGTISESGTLVQLNIHASIHYTHSEERWDLYFCYVEGKLIFAQPSWKFAMDTMDKVLNPVEKSDPWKTTKVFQGNPADTRVIMTEPFSVPEKWKIRWEAPGLCRQDDEIPLLGFSIYDGDRFVKHYTHSPSDGTGGEHFIHSGAGNYKLEISSNATTWLIEVATQ